MSSKYLNDTGLGYFWGKIKAWCSSTFAAIAHTQSSDTINLMTGYSKPASASAISTSDTLNQAIGKLEKSIDDADISNVVHKTGDEDIYGIKTFFGDPDNDAKVCRVIFRQKGFTRGDVVSDYTFWSIQCLDETNAPRDDTGNHGRIGILQCMLTPSDLVEFSLSAYENTYGTMNRGVLAVGYNKANSEAYARAPSTLLTRNAGTDIVTRDWIPKDDRIVHNGGTEYIAGLKRFTAGAVSVINTSAGINVNPTDPMYWGFNFMDKDDNPSARILHYYNNNAGNRGLSISISKKAAASDLCSIITGILIPSTNKYATYIGNTGCTALAPYVAGITLGENSTAHRWGQIYSSSTAISTSDERVKTSVEFVPEKVLDAWENVSWIQFQMKDAIEEKGISARIHNGLIAQQIDSAFSKFGLNASRYGLFCYDEWDAEETVYDDTGNVLTPGQEAGNIYSVRYEEALCMEAAYMRRENARLKKRIADLEERLAALELKVS